MSSKKKIEKCAELLQNADSVLIGAGSGLSRAAGLDYLDKEAFARDFPVLVKKGFSMKTELIGFTDWPPEMEWAYYSKHVKDFRFNARPHPVYTRLLEMVKDKNYFVLTSNVDAMFIKSGFSNDRIFTPQGDYARIQCLKPCTNETWPSKPIIEKIIPNIDNKTFMITDPSVIPSCPNCGGPVFLNVRAGNWFVEEPYKEQAKRLNKWLKSVKNSRFLLIEIGAEFNTPVVVRWPMEQITNSNPKSYLIRVNLQYPQVQSDIKDRSIELKCDAMEFINALWEMVGLNREKF